MVCLNIRIVIGFFNEDPKKGSVILLHIKTDVFYNDIRNAIIAGLFKSGGTESDINNIPR